MSSARSFVFLLQKNVLKRVINLAVAPVINE